MNAWTPKRFNRDSHIDWRGIGECCLRAMVVLVWFGFVVLMLARALGRAP